MTAFTSKAAGNWSASGQTTWNQVGTPGNGDTVVISHAVAVDTNTTIGASGPITPTTAPTVNLSTGTTVTSLPTGTYAVLYTYVDSGGKESFPYWTNTSTGAITNGSSKPRITLPANPTGIASKNLYLSDTGGSTCKLYATGITGTTVDLIAAQYNDDTVAFASATALPDNHAIRVAGGSLTVNTGVTLTVRGNCVLQNKVLTLAAGSSYIFDSSAAATTWNYAIMFDGLFNSTANVVCNGSSGSRCTVGKAASSGNGLIQKFLGSNSVYSQLQATYTDFSDLGTSSTGNTNDALELNLAATGMEFKAQHCAFTRCGRVYAYAAAAGSKININFNQFSGALGTFLMWVNNATAPTSDRNITDNNFCDGDTAKSFVIEGRDDGYTFDRNIYAVTTPSSISGAGGMASCRDNMRVNRVPTSASVSSIGSGGTTLLDNYVFWDTGIEGRGIDGARTSSGTTGTTTFDGLIYDGAADYEGSDAWNCGGGNAANTIFSHVRGIVLPNTRGGSSGNFTHHGDANQKTQIEHCTLMTGEFTGSSTGQTAVYSGSGYDGFAGMFPYVRDNIVWVKTPGSLIGEANVFYRSVLNTAEVATASGLDYNATFNCTDGTVYDAAGANGVTKRGYQRLWTASQSSVAAHDITLTGSDETTGGPKFVDSTRNCATFDTAYLGNSASAWADATSYSVGDIRSAATSTFYGNATINYRCVLAHTSSAGHATNGKPGSAASYRTNWEFASVYRIREAIIAGTTITDAALGLSSANYIRALHHWVRAGFAPRESSLQNAGHDSVTIGAVEGVFAVAPTITSNGGGPTANIDVLEGNTNVTTNAATGDAPITWGFTGGDDFYLFNLDPVTGDLESPVPLDYENPIDFNTDNVYEVIVEASNAGGADTQAINITVINDTGDDPVSGRGRSNNLILGLTIYG